MHGGGLFGGLFARRGVETGEGDEGRRASRGCSAYEEIDDNVECECPEEV